MSNKEIIKEHGKSDRLTRERDERCIPIAKTILKMITDYDNGKFGTLISSDELKKSNDDLAEKILLLLVSEKVKVNEVDFIISLIGQITNTPLNLVVGSISVHTETAFEKLWGKKRKDVDMQDLNNLLEKKS